MNRLLAQPRQARDLRQRTAVPLHADGIEDHHRTVGQAKPQRRLVIGGVHFADQQIEAPQLRMHILHGNSPSCAAARSGIIVRNRTIVNPGQFPVFDSSFEIAFDSKQILSFSE